MLRCSKIGGLCPYPIKIDPKFIFVIMPFDGFDSIYDIIKQTIALIPKKKYYVERADDKHTNQAIWCSRICQNIRKAGICIADTTGKNANVFYELGFAHALSNNTTVIITQNINDAPFDIREMGHIVYSEKNLPELRDELSKALINSEKRSTIKNNGTDISYLDLSKLAKDLKPYILEELFKDQIEKEIISQITRKENANER